MGLRIVSFPAATLIMDKAFERMLRVITPVTVLTYTEEAAHLNTT